MRARVTFVQIGPLLRHSAPQGAFQIARACLDVRLVLQFHALLVGDGAGQTADLIHKFIDADRAPILILLRGQRGHKVLAGNTHKRLGGVQIGVAFQLVQHIAKVGLRDLQGLQVLHIPLCIAADAGNGKTVPLLFQISYDVRVGGAAIHNHLFHGGFHLRG